jgi:hypothetical protein
VGVLADIMLKVSSIVKIIMKSGWNCLMQDIALKRFKMELIEKFFVFSAKLMILLFFD